MALLNVENVTFQYPEHRQKVLDDVSFEIESGDFTVICGPSGCGKTTLLKLLKKELQPEGDMTGRILYKGKETEAYDARTLIEEIGLVFQDPDNQIVLDEVFQEIVFAMENLGYDHFEMQKRVAEMVSFFGVGHLLYAKPSELSGGQKQLINILSVMLLRPKILLLDEPTAQLDPVATRELLTILEKLNQEMGTTIILVEHRLEDLFSIADRVILMQYGQILENGPSKSVIAKCLQAEDHPFKLYMPSLSRLFVERTEDYQASAIPTTVKETKQWLDNIQGKLNFVSKEKVLKNDESETYLSLKDVYFQYDRTSPFVLEGLNLTIQKGDYFALVGGNGSGKTTLLKACLGLLSPQRGKIKLDGKHLKAKNVKKAFDEIAYLPQNPKTFFIHDTVEAEMQAVVKTHAIASGDAEIDKWLQYFEIEHLRHRHPYDCSGGEMQRIVLACLLLRSPSFLFIDEPTKGLDPLSKQKLAQILNELHQAGLTIMMVTHDIEFTAKYAQSAAILFNGNLSALGTPDKLFKGNYFYTTMMNRATRDIAGLNALTLGEALTKWPKEILQ